MSCAYRTHRYRASVTAHPASVSWRHVTRHPHHPISLRLPVMRPEQQAVAKTEPSADDTPVSLSLVQYLWSQWQAFPSGEQHTVAMVDILGELMRSPRWHWDVTVLPDQSLPDPQHPFVFERDGRPTIGMPITMLRELWRWVLDDTDERASVLRWWASSIDSPRWKELCTHQQEHAPWLTKQAWYRLYGYLSPVLLPDIVRETAHLLSSDNPDDQQMALTMLTRWMASDDHATRDLAARMLHGWPHVVAALVRSRAFDEAIRDTLDRLVPTILTATRPEDRAAWVATLWELVTDATLSDERRQMVAAALHHMMQDPIVGALLRARLRAHLSPQRIMTEPVWDPLLATLIRTVCADEVVTMIEQALATVRATMGPDCDPIVRRFDRILAAGWGHGQDHRILQIIDSLPGRHWKTVLTEGVTASVGEVVCDRIGSWFPRDQALAMIVHHIHDREKRGDWPLAPLPEYLIPWVGAAARSRPDRLRSNTIRRLWQVDPVRAWDVTQTILDSDDPFDRQCAIAAMDAGWGTGMDDTIATTLCTIILQNPPFYCDTACATAVAGIGRATPAIIESLLTELMTRGNTEVRQWLIHSLHRGWGRGQDNLVMRIVETMVARDPSEWIWEGSHDTLVRAWDYQPPQMVMSLVDRMVTCGMHRLMHSIPTALDDAIAAFAPGWTHLPTAHMIERIAHHVARLHEHAHTIGLHRRNALVDTWAAVITVGAERLSVSDIHALLDPLWDLSPYWCLSGVARAVRR